MLIILLTFCVKVVLAPLFFFRLIKQTALRFLVRTYLNIPATLIILVVVTAVAHSQKLSPLTSIVPQHQALLSLALSAMMASLLLVVNNMGALSQLLGVLSLENSIVAFTVFAGLEQSLGLQIGILFDIVVLVVIASTFVSMIYRHFGSLDVTAMKSLKD